MQDPFRPNSNAQLMREAQVGLIVIGLLLCVLVYVAFYRLTNRSSRFDEMSRSVAVAEIVDAQPYQWRHTTKRERQLPTSTDVPSNRSGFEVAKKSNQANPPKKLPKVKPPVLKSKFGGASSHDFLPTPIPREKSAENRASSFSAAPSLPEQANMNSASKILPTLKPAVSRSVDKIVTRQLPTSSREDQSNSFAPQRSAPQKQIDPPKADFSQPPERPLIAQTSAIEPVRTPPVRTAPDAVLEPVQTVINKKASNKLGQTYATRAGDSLWTIAQAVYGDGRYFRALHRINQNTLNLSDSIPVGTVLKVLKTEELQRDYPELCPKQDGKNYSQDQPDATDTASTREEELDKRFYVTEDGDTLFEIARQRLGQASRYLEIHELNRFRIPETANHLTRLGGGIELLLPE